MPRLIQTEEFRIWLRKLKDRKAQGLIALRLERFGFGHPGDAKPVGDGIFELRLHFGPGYRVYFQRRGNTVVLLLLGGDKSTQAKDIRAAKQIAERWIED